MPYRESPPPLRSHPLRSSRSMHLVIALMGGLLVISIPFSALTLRFGLRGLLAALD